MKKSARIALVMPLVIFWDVFFLVARLCYNLVSWIYKGFEYVDKKGEVLIDEFVNKRHD